MYGFSSSDPKFAKTGDSPYWMDEPTYQDVQARHYDPVTDKWNNPNVKNELALLRYNDPNTLYRGQLTEDQPLVTSNIGHARETVTYANPNGTSTVFTRTMTGGGTRRRPS